MAKKLDIPGFSNDSEESEWWYAHREEVDEDLLRGIEEGRVRPSGLTTSGSTPTTSIRLDPSDISKARVAAARRGLKYQTYLKMLIHEALERESAV